MYFAELAEYLDRLEKTASRLEMTRILAELFSKVTPEEGKIIAYLSQGLLGPKYNNPDTGMGDKQVVKALILLDSDVEKIFKETGDLGKTVEKIKSQITNNKSQTNHKLQITNVYGRLVQIAKVGGSGSVDEKSRLLGELIGDLDSVGAKYAVKMILGKLRTGFSDMTVLDALSYMIAGDKSLRENIEQIYNVRADLGETVRLIKSQDALKTLKIDPVVGMPVLVARAERAKTVAEIWERNGVSAAEHKLDGLRIQAHVFKSEILNSKFQTEIKLFSRGMENVTAMYPDIVEGLSKQIKVDCILDGEMIAVGEDGKYRPFQETVQRKRKYNILEMMESVPLKYYVFDVLSAGGKSFLEEPNEKRWNKLESIVSVSVRGDTIKLMPRIIVKSEKGIQDFFDEALGEGTEGIVVKKLDGTYKSGSRDFTWIKYKKSYDESAMADTIDAVIMGYDVGQGKRVGFGIGDFLIGVYDDRAETFKTIAKVGTGLTDEEWKQVKLSVDSCQLPVKPESFDVSKSMEVDVWCKPKIVVEILADEITKSPMHTSGLALRFPRLVSFREKKPEDATSIGELNRLFMLQKK